MSQYIKTYIDIEGMIDALLTITKMKCSNNHTNGGSSDEAWDVADNRTVGLTVGRQCGATHGSLMWMAKRPNQCLHITKDSMMRDALKTRYTEITGKPVDYVSLVPCISDTFKRWTRLLTAHDTATIKYIVVDDALFTVTTSHCSRAGFNKWVAETFGKDTYVVLIK